MSITKYLKSEYGLEQDPGAWGECPFCGAKKFWVPLNDSEGDCHRCNEGLENNKSFYPPLESFNDKVNFLRELNRKIKTLRPGERIVLHLGDDVFIYQNKL